ncbi:dihydrolipoyl dehydrogenase [Anaerofustis stercorihominis]|uniref:Dihydrolipoyl dehydrogenase n=1 Tax=Anaerofustis stercorihominis TaxID=214853 RepID=A0A3E3E1W3_9FIRM|nr:dihydrolipoyl dehydrogenase [Anaerofustis stercorihominis]RGD75551.1 dihydrolipoyl dehydrogenase [Anaerofustis stercorihominis]
MYDVIVIGAGPGGYLAAERAAEGGKKTLLIEKEHIGGVCLNEGCIPTKTLLYSAKLYDGALHGDKYGIKAEKISIDHKAVIKRKDKVIKTLVGGVSAALKSKKVEVIMGSAVIKGKKDGKVQVEVNGEIKESTYLIIASGSDSVKPPIPGVAEGLESGFVLTNKEVLKLEVPPKEFVVIGGGVIGLEMASYFNSIGSKVTVVEMLDKIAGPTDNTVSEILKKEYEKKGITFNLSSRVTKLDNEYVYFEKDGKEEKVKADKVLLSIGRRANTLGLGLESLNIYIERGCIKVDEKQETNVANVYAVGDCVGGIMLAHTAYREAEVAVNNILGKKDRMKYNAVPSVIYTNPEIASVGESEESAKEKGMDVTIRELPMQYSGRYVAENEGGSCIIRIVVDKKWNTLVGVHMIANYASELILGAVTMVESQISIDEIKKIIFPHPSVGEIIREAIFTL